MPGPGMPCLGLPRLVIASVVVGWLALAPVPASAATNDEDTAPRWEAGLGVSAISFPAYRGSRQQVTYALPIPYFVYRSDRLSVDRDGARGLLYARGPLEVDLSFDGAIPVDSDDNGPRAGMDDLDPVIELGPSLNWMLTADRRWQLRLPVRAAIAIDGFSTRQQGWTAHPQIRYVGQAPPGGWNLNVTFGPIFATREFHAFYYDVGGDDVIADERPAFRSSGGYSGTSLQLGISRRSGRLWFGSFVRYEHLGGAAFVDSPLVETETAVTAGLGIAWVFRESTERVHRR